MYEFSVPMPYLIEDINRIIDINQKIVKSKIKCLYFAMPVNCTDTTGFEQLRTIYKEKTTFEHWKSTIEYVLENDFDFIYLLNSPRNFIDIEKVLEIQLEKLDKLIFRLKELGCNKVRISNTQLLNYIINNYPELEIYTSTSFEHTKLSQYKIFLEMFPQIKGIVPSFEVNKNFPLLKNLRQLCTSVNIELMVNEGCLAGCPIRSHHNLALPFLQMNTYVKRKEELTYSIFQKICNKFQNEHIFDNICNSNIIYPWQIEEYRKIGINNFKIVGRNNKSFVDGTNMSFYEIYLKAIDDYNFIKNMPYKSLNTYFQEIGNNITVDEARKLLPKIQHFKKNGHLCASICGVKCKYCFECTKKMEKYINNKKI